MKYKQRYIPTSPLKQKIFSLLLAGFSFGLTRSLRKQKMIFEELKNDWKEIDRRHLKRILNEFKKERYIDFKENRDGTVDVILTKNGKIIANRCKIDVKEIRKMKKWDHLWRIVFFDVPEEKREIRNSIRRKLKQLGFYEMQKSVFIHPMECFEEISVIMDFFDAYEYINYGELSSITNEKTLKKYFHLT